jgi:hypothetical protein
MHGNLSPPVALFLQTLQGAGQETRLARLFAALACVFQLHRAAEIMTLYSSQLPFLPSLTPEREHTGLVAS